MEVNVPTEPDSVLIDDGTVPNPPAAPQDPPVNPPEPPENPPAKDDNPANQPDYPKWMAQTAGENKTNERLAKFSTIDELSKEYLTLSEKLEQGKLVPLPGEDASDEEMQAYLKAIGVPDTPDLYKKVDSELPEGIGYTEEEFSQLREMAHKLAWTNSQFEAFQTWENETAKKKIQEATAVLEAKKKETKEYFVKEWGSNYDENLNLMKKGVQEFGGPEFLKKLGPAGNLPEVVNFLVEKGRSVRDDSLLDGEAPGKEEKVPPGQIYYPSMKGM